MARRILIAVDSVGNMDGKLRRNNRIHLALVIAPIAICILALAILEYRDDPRTIAASRGAPEIVFTRLPESSRVYRIVNRRTGLLGYLTLSANGDERLTTTTGPILGCEPLSPLSSG